MVPCRALLLAFHLSGARASLHLLAAEYHSDTWLPYRLVSLRKVYGAFLRLPRLHLRKRPPSSKELLVDSRLLQRWSSPMQGRGGHFP